MGFRGARKEKSGFTLAELIVVIALVALICGMVAVFVVYMAEFTDSSDAYAAQSEELTKLRAETDEWFSYADRDGTEIVFGEDGYIANLAADSEESGSETEDYSGVYISGGSTQFVFSYGIDDEKNVTLSFENPYSLSFSDADGAESQQDADSVLLRFSVVMRVTGQVYVCEVCDG